MLTINAALVCVALFGEHRDTIFQRFIYCLKGVQNCQESSYIVEKNDYSHRLHFVLTNNEWHEGTKLRETDYPDKPIYFVIVSFSKSVTNTSAVHKLMPYFKIQNCAALDYDANTPTTLIGNEFIKGFDDSTPFYWIQSPYVKISENNDMIVKYLIDALKTSHVPRFYVHLNGTPSTWLPVFVDMNNELVSWGKKSAWFIVRAPLEKLNKQLVSLNVPFECTELKYDNSDLNVNNYEWDSSSFNLNASTIVKFVGWNTLQKYMPQNTESNVAKYFCSYISISSNETSNVQLVALPGDPTRIFPAFCKIDENTVLLHGGMNAAYEILGDLFIGTITTQPSGYQVSWQQVVNFLHPLCLHASYFDSNTQALWLQGGIQDTEKGCTNNLIRIQLADAKKSKVVVQIQEFASEVKALYCTNHAIVVVSNLIFVFGGFDKNGKPLRAFTIVDTITLKSLLHHKVSFHAYNCTLKIVDKQLQCKAPSNNIDGKYEPNLTSDQVVNVYNIYFKKLWRTDAPQQKCDVVVSVTVPSIKQTSISTSIENPKELLHLICSKLFLTTFGYVPWRAIQYFKLYLLSKCDVTIACQLLFQIEIFMCLACKGYGSNMHVEFSGFSEQQETWALDAIAILALYDSKITSLFVNTQENMKVSLFDTPSVFLHVVNQQIAIKENSFSNVCMHEFHNLAHPFGIKVLRLGNNLPDEWKASSDDTVETNWEQMISHCKQILFQSHYFQPLDLEQLTLLKYDAAMVVAALKSGIQKIAHLHIQNCHIDEHNATALAKLLEIASELRTISMQYVNFQDKSATVLSKLKFSSTLSELNLGWSHIGPIGAKPIANLLPKLPKLTNLDLNSNLLNEKSMEYISMMLCRCVLLENLNFSHNAIGNNGANALAMALSTKLTTLNISSATIGDIGATAIANKLKFCQELEVLDISRNSISYLAVTALAIVLPSMVKLKSLNLNDNAIGNIGAKALSLALPSCPQLQELRIADIGIDNIGALDLASAFTDMRSAALPNAIALTFLVMHDKFDSATWRSIEKVFENCNMRFLDIAPMIKHYPPFQHLPPKGTFQDCTVVCY